MLIDDHDNWISWFKMMILLLLILIYCYYLYNLKFAFIKYQKLSGIKSEF